MGPGALFPYESPLAAGADWILCRKCVFQNIADKVVKVTISGLVEAFDIDVKDKKVGQNPATFLYAPTGTLIFKPRDGRKI